ncbi:hypothetical protein NDA07_23390 [Microcoleus vaginatus DQ-U2]|uniref:hypothetical protein n=1 Tax=Microcoleus vaginatus TaxID=119532 RepID=UPI0016868CC7|nr:hypothetical protein [Microcoleus sp. FACHB-DQ6]
MRLFVWVNIIGKTRRYSIKNTWTTYASRHDINGVARATSLLPDDRSHLEQLRQWQLRRRSGWRGVRLRLFSPRSRSRPCLQNEWLY